MGTYLEDYLESIYMLPSEIKRNFDLMRDLDKTSYALIDDLKSTHSAFLVHARKKVLQKLTNNDATATEDHPTEDELKQLIESDEQLVQLKSQRQQVVQKLDEKYAIACQSYDIIDHHIRRLDADLQAYAELLRSMGEFEEDKTSNNFGALSMVGGSGSSTGALSLSGAIGAASASASSVSSSASSAALATSGSLKKKKSSSSNFANAQQQNAGTPVLKKQSTPLNTGSGSGNAGGGFSGSSTGGGGTSSGRKRSAAEAFDALTPSGTVSNATLGGLNAAAMAMPEDLAFDPNEPVYCLCRRISYGQMIGCDNDDCKYEWFHFDCVGLTEQPAGKWYCPDCTSHLK